jgi:putative PIN family toxin of toxin-antitoxin system
VGKKKKLKRVVLDTNILVSSLLFGGKLSRIVDLWMKRKIVPLITAETFEEFQKVLTYPKFSLTEEEIKILIQEYILPYFEVVEPEESITGICDDPEDDKFLTCALSGNAEFLVRGDKQLCKLRKYRNVQIIDANEFLLIFKEE